MGHVVLLGDSVFDNARYVPDRPPVIEQLRQALPRGWRATLLAVDGHITEDVVNQLPKVPADATHLIVSSGGNDALGEYGVLNEPVSTVREALDLVHVARTTFAISYHAMLHALSALKRPSAVCTVYDTVPGLSQAEQAALGCYNEVILREAFAARLPVIDLRLVCDRPADYSHLSSIEPSVVGGAKIVQAITTMLATHDFSSPRSTIYA